MKKIGLFFAVCWLVACTPQKKMEITVANGSASDRTDELVEVSWHEVTARLGVPDTARLVVTEAATGQQVPYQLIRNGGKDVQSVLFPATVAAGASSVYTLQNGVPEQFEPKVYGRQVPERKDDFAWENDKAAFRMYGPALEATGEISNGIDLWVKKTDKLVIDDWYKNDLAGIASYHQDHGEGLDFYKVGRTLGLGALAPFVRDTLWLGKNYTRVEVLDQGPLRLVFRLWYAPFGVDGRPVAETRTISLDANSRLNKVVERFETEIPAMAVASGIVLRPEEGGSMEYDAEKGYAAYAEPKASDGVIYAGMVSLAGFRSVQTACGHLLGLNDYKPGTDYTYYTGGGWSQAGFATPEDWFAYIRDFASRLKQPLTVTID